MATYCLIIPVHPPHYNWIEGLLKTMIEHCIDTKCIYLVFSNQTDFDCFPHKQWVNHIIADEYHGKRGIVTFKKLFALQKIYKENPYEYYILCDAETDIIPCNFNKENIKAKLDAWFEKKTLWGGKVGLRCVFDIIKGSASLFSLQDQDILREKLQGWTNYTWWSDVPVYKHEHLDEFFEMIGPGYLEKIEYEHFDHLIYQYFLMLRYGFEYVDTGYGWSLESHIYQLETLNKIKEKGCEFTWVIPQAYAKNKDFYDGCGTFLLYHLDRKVFYSERGYMRL